MTKKQLLRSIAFILIVGIMLVVLSDLYELDNNKNFDKRFYTYRTYPEDTVDAVYVGTSGVDRYWIASKAYEDYGMTVYPLSSDALPSWLYTNVVDEALAHQDPELFIFDIRGYFQSHTAEKMDTYSRRLIGSLDFFSINRFKIAYKTAKMIHSIDDSKSQFDLSFVFSFIKFHSRWQEEDYSFHKNIGSRQHEYAGFFMNSSLSTLSKPQQPLEYDESALEQLNPISEAALYELLDYVRERNLKVLFVDSPKMINQREMGIANQVFKILDKEGFDYISFNKVNEDSRYNIDFDYEKDFYDDDHVNFYGAQKYTDALSAYINDNYDLPDRRNDEHVKENWDNVYSKIVKKIKDYEK